jgi:hypothetical protein
MIPCMIMSARSVFFVLVAIRKIELPFLFQEEEDGVIVILFKSVELANETESQTGRDAGYGAGAVGCVCLNTLYCEYRHEMTSPFVTGTLLHLDVCVFRQAWGKCTAPACTGGQYVRP